MFNANVWTSLYANDLDAFVPEVWAAESLRVLYEMTVAVPLVHRDFENDVAEFGDVVNSRRPAKFVSVRKSDGSDVTTQNATATNVPVRLDQHHHVSFVIHDGAASKGMTNLVEVFLRPAMQAVAQGLDEMVLGERYSFIANRVGQLGTPPTSSTLIDAATKLTDNLCPLMDRRAIISPSMKGALLKVDSFTEADKIGDDGTALREGSLGKLYGLQTHETQNLRTITASDVTLGAINVSGGLAAGTTALTVDGFSGAPSAGSWLTVAGDMTPQLVIGSPTTTAITIAPGLSSAVENDAVVTVYDPALVNFSPSYDQYHTDAILVDSMTKAVRTGQMVSVGGTSLAATSMYANMSQVNGASATSILLNRSLDSAILNNAVMGVGPAGDYGFAFHRDAIAFVSRPLALPDSNLTRSAVIDMDGVGLRVVITYDGVAQGHRVTIDVLAGVKTLDTNLGALILG